MNIRITDSKGTRVVNLTEHNAMINKMDMYKTALYDGDCVGLSDYSHTGDCYTIHFQDGSELEEVVSQRLTRFVL